MKTPHETNMEDIDVAAALANLDDTELDSSDIEVEAVTEIDEPETIVEEEIDEADLAPEDHALIEAETTKSEIYAEQVAANPPSAEPEPAKKAKKAPSKKAAAGPKMVRDLNDLDAKHFVLTTTEPDDLAANKAAVIARRPKQVKVAEKFDNVLTSIAAEKAPSVYVMKAFAALNKTGEITSADLYKALAADGMGEGTARSQAGQMMSLFPALQIAKRDQNKLILNQESLIAEAIKLLASA